jgi:excisionase family DNA binding protein
MSPPPEDRLLTTEQAAQMLGVSASFLNKARVHARPEIPFVKVGASVRYRRADLDAFISENARRSTSARSAA